MHTMTRHTRAASASHLHPQPRSPRLTAALALLTLSAGLLCTATSAEVSVKDDEGNTVTLERPAQRVVSLAPHVTEMLFAIGAGAKIVGVANYSDFPEAAKSIPRVSDNSRIDLEKLLALKPDLLVVWLPGAAERQLEPIRRLGIPFFYSQPHKLADFPEAYARLGTLLGVEAQARQAGADFRRQYDALQAQYRGRPTVRVFYQVWNRPLYTLNGTHMVSDVIRLCGGENIFASLQTTAPTVDPEAVIGANPEAIITGKRSDRSETGLEMWQAYPGVTAVKRNNLFSVNADLINRPGPRILQGAAEICEALDTARKRRADK